MMTALLLAREYESLQQFLDLITEPISEPNIAERDTSPNDLIRLILAKPWRRTSVSDSTRLSTFKKISCAITARQPIEFSVPFGGYKSWRLPVFPHIDWAEVFWIAYLRNYSIRLAGIYTPGVIISLSYVGGVLDWLNKYPPNSQDIYLSELRELLQEFSSTRVKFNLVDHANSYGGTDGVLRELKERELVMPQPGPLEIAAAKRNIYQYDNSNNDLAEISARRCMALLSLEKRREFNKGGYRIQITHIRGGTDSIHLGSCRSSIAQPWVSTGYLDWSTKSGCWIERLATAKRDNSSLEDISVKHRLADISPSLRRIRLSR